MLLGWLVLRGSCSDEDVGLEGFVLGCNECRAESSFAGVGGGNVFQGELELGSSMLRTSRGCNGHYELSPKVGQDLGSRDEGRE